mgnify:CR=1 FL=1
MNTTDLNKVKSIAKTFLFLTPKESKVPFVVHHPFFETPIAMRLDKEHNSYYTVNIMEDAGALSEIRKDVAQQIADATSLEQIELMLVNKYKLAFLKDAAPYMSDEDVGGFLRRNWSLIEVTSGDPNASRTQIVKLFRRAGTVSTTSTEDNERLDNLPDEVTIYRGVTEYNKNMVKGLSWSLSLDTARWFAHRFRENGHVYKATINKKDVLALYTDRNESEVVVDFRRLQNIELIE